MSDNTILNAPSSTGDTIASDDIGSVKYPRSKIVHGADGVNDGDVSKTNPLPTDPPQCSAATGSQIPYSAISTLAVALNAARKGLAFYNNADKHCYVRFGAGATTANFTKRLSPGEYWEPARNYTGRVDVIWDAGGTGALHATEFAL